MNAVVQWNISFLTDDPGHWWWIIFSRNIFRFFWVMCAEWNASEKKKWTGRMLPLKPSFLFKPQTGICLQNGQIGTSLWIWRCYWQGKWHASSIMLKKLCVWKEKVWCCEQEAGGKLAHPASFTLIVLALLSRRCRVTDRWARADTCFWRSLIFKCSSCVNTNTCGNQLAACTWYEWHAALYLPISLSVLLCHVVRILFS